MTEQEPSELQKMLSTFFKWESNGIQRQHDKLKEAYDVLPDLIKGTSEMMGIDAELLVGLAYKVKCAKENLNLCDVIHVLYLFYAHKERDEYEKSTEKQ